MSLVLKLSKCRLCLKLGDFYSIFAADSSIQLSKMAMACSEIKIYEGDGLPDKICGECIEKLSSAYIFKQQCERSDAELRKTLNINNSAGAPEISPYGRRSSDSGFSNRTDVSTSKKEKPTTKLKSKPNKSIAKSGGLLEESYSIDISDPMSFEGAPTYKKNPAKSKSSESGSNSPVINENARFECRKCDKTFLNAKSLNTHLTLHKNDTDEEEEEEEDDDEYEDEVSIVESAKNSPTPDSKKKDNFECNLCQKTFKFNIMLNRHLLTCKGPEPTAAGKQARITSLMDLNVPHGSLKCPVCNKLFTKRMYAVRHFRRSVCSKIALEFPEQVTKLPAEPVLRKEKKTDKTKAKTASKTSAFQAECSICTAGFSSHMLMFKHFQLCFRRRGSGPIMCKTCNLSYVNSSGLYKHIRKIHVPLEHSTKKQGGEGLLKPKAEPVSGGEEGTGGRLKCMECDKTFSDQTQLVMHLAAHMANINEPKKKGVAPTVGKQKESKDTNFECQECYKKFRYKGNWRIHLKVHHDYCPEDIVSAERKFNHHTCDKCNKTFQSEKSLIYHTNSKHSKMSSKERQMSKIVPASSQGEERMTEPINFLTCPVKCHHCNITLPGQIEAKEHNIQHLAQNEKPNNEYTCPVCNVNFKNKKYFSSHIIEHNSRLSKKQSQGGGTVVMDDSEGVEEDQDEAGVDGAEDSSGEMNAMDFCESVVANIKQEKQGSGSNATEGGHGGTISGTTTQIAGKGQTLVVTLGGFTCLLCKKTLSTLKSYKYHMNWHASRGKDLMKNLTCSVCQQEFQYETHLQNHLKQHWHSNRGNGEGYSCAICQQVFQSDTNLRDHVKQHAAESLVNPSILDCKECGRRIKNVKGFVIHMNWHKSLKDLQCPVCLKQFNKLGNFNYHYKQHVKKNEITVVDNYDIDPSTPKLHNVTNFQCHICQKYMPTEVSLSHHVRWHNSNTARFAMRYKCPTCNVSFTNKVRHMLHMRMHDGPLTPYKCHICHRYLKSAALLFSHVKSHSSRNRKPGSMACPICDQYYPNQLKLQRHIQRSHPEEKMVKKKDPGADDLPVTKHICKICGKEFPTEYKLKNHNLRHERKPTFYICSLCGKRNISPKLHRLHIKSHLHQRFKDNPLKCERCTETFVRRQELHVHLFQAHGILETYTVKYDDRKNVETLKDCQCPICFRILARESNYLRHLDYHNSMRCNYCLKYFTSKPFMEAHVMYDCDRKLVLGGADSFEKRLKCTVCYKPFSVAIKLRCHMRVQHGKDLEMVEYKEERHTVCDFCFTTYPSEQAMRKHRAQHERFIPIYGCKMCPKKFTTLTYYHKHKNSHIHQYFTENPIQCEHCDEKFIYFPEYSTHLKEAHDAKVDWLIPPTDSPTLECTICHKSFSHIHNHYMYHEKYRCKKCKEYFFSDFLYDCHICDVDSDPEDENETHKAPLHPTLDQEPYEECPFCFKPYTYNYSKGMHRITHNKVLSFSCLYCEKKFTSLTLFAIHSSTHRRRHYKDNPLLCKHCGEKFIKYGVYIKHLREAHQEKENMIIRPKFPPQECKICKRTFSNIHYHYRFHLQFRCKSCLKYIMSEKLYNTHICNDPNEDPTLILEYNEDITSLTVGHFDYNTLRHRPLHRIAPSPEVEASEQTKDYPLDDIDIIESELDDSVLNNVDISNMSYSPDISISNQDMIVQIPDQVVFGGSSTGSFENFTPVISSTVSLSQTTSLGTSEDTSNVLNDEASNAESAEELHKIVDDLENSFPTVENGGDVSVVEEQPPSNE